jgi:hypothetical protein
LQFLPLRPLFEQDKSNVTGQITSLRQLHRSECIDMVRSQATELAWMIKESEIRKSRLNNNIENACASLSYQHEIHCISKTELETEFALFEIAQKAEWAQIDKKLNIDREKMMQRHKGEHARLLARQRLRLQYNH